MLSIYVRAASRVATSVSLSVCIFRLCVNMFTFVHTQTNKCIYTYYMIAQLQKQEGATQQSNKYAMLCHVLQPMWRHVHDGSQQTCDVEMKRRASNPCSEKQTFG